MQLNKKISFIIIFTFFIKVSNVQAEVISNLDKPNNDKWVAIDKLQHFGYSIFVSLGCQYVLVNKLEIKETDAILVSSVISFGAGLAKEIQDKKSSYFSRKDMIANFLGISAAFVIVKIP